MYHSTRRTHTKPKMSKREKSFRSILPQASNGVAVIDGDLKYALQHWRRKMKASGKLKEVYKRREFVKPSVKRRKTIADATYKQQQKSESEKSR